MQKLELTWIGKNEQPQVEPRILRHDPSKDYGAPDSQNMLIHGDNLLALKALEQDYAGKIKCIYIDPPYNTGAAFEYYDDNLEHSIWLNLMYQRLKSLKTLLADDGVIAIQIDDSEMPYLRVIMDEIFGRNRFVAQISVRSNSISGPKTAHKDKTVLRNKDNIIIYKKGDNIVVHPQYVKKEEWDTHYNYYLKYDPDGNPIEIIPLKDLLIEKNIIKKGATVKKDLLNNQDFYDFILLHKKNIFQLVNSISASAKQESKTKPNTIIKYTDDNGVTRYAYNGRRISLLKSSIIEVDNEEIFAQLLGDLWTDIDFQNTQNEGGVSFPNNKKPEVLIKRVLNLFTEPNDWVLDSFLGSGTTAAVAHKMNRRWIGIELGDHCHTHCIPRINNVINGNDPSGISKAVNWQGGGGYKFYELAPTLIEKDKYGNPVFSSQYDDKMLAEAVAKLNGFSYSPDPDVYWKQGYSQENSYIYISSQYLTTAQLDSIAGDMTPFEQLLICVPAFDNGLNKRYDNINIRKIPQSILNKYEFGANDYNLNIVNPPINDVNQEEENQDD